MEHENVCGDCSLCCKLPPIYNKKQDNSIDYNSAFKKASDASKSYKKPGE